MRSKETARVKSGPKTGGKQSGAGKRKSATALANAAGLMAVKALAAKRKRPQETENEIDELREEGEDGEDGEEEGEEEEEEGEESGEIEELESQEAETQGDAQKKEAEIKGIDCFIALASLHMS